MQSKILKTHMYDLIDDEVYYFHTAIMVSIAYLTDQKLHEKEKNYLLDRIRSFIKSDVEFRSVIAKEFLVEMIRLLKEGFDKDESNIENLNSVVSKFIDDINEICIEKDSLEKGNIKKILIKDYFAIMNSDGNKSKEEQELIDYIKSNLLPDAKKFSYMNIVLWMFTAFNTWYLYDGIRNFNDRANFESGDFSSTESGILKIACILAGAYYIYRIKDLENKIKYLFKNVIFLVVAAFIFRDSIEFMQIARYANAVKSNVEILNVRSDCTKDANIITTISNDKFYAQIQSMNNCDDWARIKVDNKIGYVSKEFVEITDRSQINE